MGSRIMVIIHICGPREVLLLFCYQEDTEYESYEMEISISTPISTHKKISKDLPDNDIHNLQDGSKILWQFFIFLDAEPFFYYFVITKTPNLSSLK